MTAPPAAERSIPAPANQALAGREAVRSSLANSSAPGCRDAAFAPQHPLPLGARDPWVEGEEEGTGTPRGLWAAGRWAKTALGGQGPPFLGQQGDWESPQPLKRIKSWHLQQGRWT